MHVSEIPDHVLVTRVEAMQLSVIRIAEMPAEQRRQSVAKGTSPEQFGFVQASLLKVFWDEAARRGLMEPL